MRALKKIDPLPAELSDCIILFISVSGNAKVISNFKWRNFICKNFDLVRIELSFLWLIPLGVVGRGSEIQLEGGENLKNCFQHKNKSQLEFFIYFVTCPEIVCRRSLAQHGLILMLLFYL